MTEGMKKLTKSIIYFQNQLLFPLSPSFQQHLQCLKLTMSNQLVAKKVFILIVQRFYEMVNYILKQKQKRSQQSFKSQQSINQKYQVQEYLITKFIQTIKTIVTSLWNIRINLQASKDIQFIKKQIQKNNIQNINEKIQTKANNNPAQYKQLIVILLSSSISLLKNNVHRSLCYQILQLIRILIYYSLQKNVVSIKSIYPQVYSQISSMIINVTTLGKNKKQQKQDKNVSQSNFVNNLGINSNSQKLGYKNFDQALKILSILIIYKQKSNIILQDKNSLLKKHLNLKKDDFQRQSEERLAYNLKSMIRMVPILQQSYLQSMKRFVVKILQQIEQNVQNQHYNKFNLQIETNFRLLSICLGLQKQQQQNKQKKNLNLIQLNIKNTYLYEIATQYFISLLNQCYGNNSMLSIQKNKTLKLMISLAPFIKFNSIDVISQKQDHHNNTTFNQNKIVKKIINTLFKIKNVRGQKITLIHQQHSMLKTSAGYSQTLGLLQLKGSNSFKNYPGGISSLLDAFKMQETALLAICLDFADGDHHIVTLLKQLLYNLISSNNLKTQNNNQNFNNAGQQLLNQIMNQMLVNQYTIDMSIQKFYQYLSSIIVIKLLIQGKNKNIQQKIDANKISKQLLIIYQKAFSLLSSSQALRILQSNYKQQELLIAESLMIMLICYNNMISYYSFQSQKSLQNRKSKIKKLQWKISIYQIILNNISQESYLIKLSTFYSILNLSAPNTIQQSFKNIQTTILNNNIGNIVLIKNIIKFSQLQSQDCQELAQVYYAKQANHNFISKQNRMKNAQILKLLIPKLSIQTIRKCILSSQIWPILLKDNTLILFNKQIEHQKNSNNNFFVKQGQNVKITNMLGVLILQLGYKWKAELISPRKQLTIGLIIELIKVSPQLFFFRRFFVENQILSLLINIVQDLKSKVQKSINYKSSQYRLLNKIVELFSLIKQFCYKIYGKQKCMQLQKALSVPKKISQKKILFANCQPLQQQFYQNLNNNIQIILDKINLLNQAQE